MAELTISPQEIREAIERNVASYTPENAREEVGRVLETGDGIARVEGLHSAMTNELLEFDGGLLGLALNLDVREIGVVLLGDGSHIEEGQQVRRTGRVLSVPVGDGFLGRVVNPLGEPIDGLGDITAEAERALEVQAPSVVQRQPVKEPMLTGWKAVDAMTAIGRGQRQLIIGDRQTGKTTVALDTILNQKSNWESGDPNKQVKCIYVAIGQKGSTIAGVRGTLEEHGALDKGVRALELRAEDSARFSTNLSHELRTPLAAIRGAAEILSERQLSAEDQVRFIGNIVTESKRLERMVAGILELSRTEQGRAAATGEVVDLLSVARSVLDATQPLLQRKALRVVGLEEATRALVLGDDDRLHRILFGLLENAIKFSPQGGEIRLEIRCTQQDVRVVVSDEGPGVPPEIRETIFERQFTTEHDGCSASRGTGLGLAIVRGLVSAANGNVWVEDSTAKGARFVLALPAAPARPDFRS